MTGIVQLVFAVFDVKAGHFSRPFFSVALGEALRSFQMECERGESMLNRYPEDYYLARLGTFDQISGVIVPENVPVQVATARDFVTLPGLKEVV